MRWAPSAGARSGSPEFERMVFNQLREFGVSVYGVEDGPKNGNYAPSFHIINHVIYHTSLDTHELVPAEGMSRSIRAFACDHRQCQQDDAGAAARAELSAQGRARHGARADRGVTEGELPPTIGATKRD